MSTPTDIKVLLTAGSGVGKKSFVMRTHRLPPADDQETTVGLSCALLADGSLAVPWLEWQDPAPNHQGTEAGNILFDEVGDLGMEGHSDLECTIGGTSGPVPAHDGATRKTLTTVGKPPSPQTAAGIASRPTKRQSVLTTPGLRRRNRKLAPRKLQINCKRLLYKLEHIGLDNFETIEQGL